MEPATARWLAEVLGTPGVAVRSLSFGIASELELVEAGGERFVLRTYPDPHALARAPGVVADEAAVLEAAREILGRLVPRLVACDATGDTAGHPAVVMSFLPGTPTIHGLDLAPVVEVLSRLHGAPVPDGLPRFAHWFDPARAAVPGWSAAPEAWARLVELATSGQPDEPAVFIHRDFHPGNLLWADGELTGIVDWVEGCHGPRTAEVAHVRANLALVDGGDAADRFLASYERANPSYRHDPWWDAAELLTWDDDFKGVMAFTAFGAQVDVRLMRSRADDFARAVCARAGG